MKKNILAATIAVPLLLAVACEQKPPPFTCTDTLGCVDIAADESILIGVIQAMSGKLAPLGQEQMRGLELALDKRGGKILGHPIVLQDEDDGCTGEGGANAAIRIIADPKTVAIFGSTCSGAAATAAKAMSSAGLAMISGNNSAPFLTAVAGKKANHWQPGYFRTAPNEETAGKAAALYAFRELGLRRAVTINDGDIYTRGLTEGFGEAFRQLGGEIALAASVSKGDKEMRPVLEAVTATGAELLFFPLFQPEGNHILRQAREMAAMSGVVLMSDGALIETSFLDAVGEAGRGMYFVGPSLPTGDAANALAAKYQEKFAAPPATSYYLSAYDAAVILFEGIERAAVREAGGKIHIGRQALRDAMYATKDFEGVTGRLSCDEFGDCAAPVFNVLRLDDPAAGLAGLQANVMFTYSPETTIQPAVPANMTPPAASGR